MNTYTIFIDIMANLFDFFLINLFITHNSNSLSRMNKLHYFSFHNAKTYIFSYYFMTFFTITILSIIPTLALPYMLNYEQFLPIFLTLTAFIISIYLTTYSKITVTLEDDAITAASKVEDGYINLTIEQTGSYLSINCNNNHCEKIEKKKAALSQANLLLIFNPMPCMVLVLIPNYL